LDAPCWEVRLVQHVQKRSQDKIPVEHGRMRKCEIVRLKLNGTSQRITKEQNVQVRLTRRISNGMVGHAPQLSLDALAFPEKLVRTQGRSDSDSRIQEIRIAISRGPRGVERRGGFDLEARSVGEAVADAGQLEQWLTEVRADGNVCSSHFSSFCDKKC